MPLPEEDLCEHLKPVGRYLRSQGYVVTYAGQPWTRNCRYWVYFDTTLDVEELRRRFDLPETISVHENADPRSGVELGLYCEHDQDAIVGHHPSERR